MSCPTHVPASSLTPTPAVLAGEEAALTPHTQHRRGEPLLWAALTWVKAKPEKWSTLVFAGLRISQPAAESCRSPTRGEEMKGISQHRPHGHGPTRSPGTHSFTHLLAQHQGARALLFWRLLILYRYSGKVSAMTETSATCNYWYCQNWGFAIEQPNSRRNEPTVTCTPRSVITVFCKLQLLGCYNKDLQ